MCVWKKLLLLLLLLLSYSLLVPKVGMAGLPKTQATLFGAVVEKSPSSGFKAHGDFSALGNSESSIDIDEAWFRAGSFTFGRIHPYALSNHFEIERPWGLLAQSHTQNRGLGLASVPVIQGWIGAHYWSDLKNEKPFQFGISASPIFIPNRGEARALPGFVEINGKPLPLEIAIDTSEIYAEVLQPQVMTQAYCRLESKAIKWESWTGVSRNPSVDPDIESIAFLDIAATQPTVKATVKPHFRQQWMGSFSQKLSHHNFEDTAFLSSVSYRQGGVIGIENGVDSKYFAISHANEFRPAKRPSDYEWNVASYGDQLIQWEAKVPVSRTTFFAGTKHHLNTGDYWRRGGIRTQVSQDFTFDVGADLFAGQKETYFGEWNGKNRLYLGLSWRLGK